MADQVEGLDIPWSFFKAHTTPNPKLQIDLSKTHFINGRNLKPSEIGCYSSHYSIWAELDQDPDHDVYIVLEDDAIIDASYFQDADEIKARTLQYGLLRFQTHRHAPANTVYYQGRRRILRYKQSVLGMLGYSIDKKTARHLINRLSVVRRPVDRELDRFWDHGVPIFAIYPVVALESYPALDKGATSQLGAREASTRRLSAPWFKWRAYRLTEALRQQVANLTWHSRWRAWHG